MLAVINRNINGLQCLTRFAGTQRLFHASAMLSTSVELHPKENLADMYSLFSHIAWRLISPFESLNRVYRKVQARRCAEYEYDENYFFKKFMGRLCFMAERRLTYPDFGQCELTENTDLFSRFLTRKY